MRGSRSHHRFAPLALLGLLALSGCVSAVPAAGPAPGQQVGGVVLHSGEAIEFPGSYRAVLEDTLLVVRRRRDDSVVRTFRPDEIDRVTVDRVDVGRTAMLGAAALVLVALFVQSLDDMSFSGR